jgi:hypothetical protein
MNKLINQAYKNQKQTHEGTNEPQTSCERTTAGSLLTHDRQAHPHTTQEEERGPPQGAKAPQAHPAIVRFLSFSPLLFPDM